MRGRWLTPNAPGAGYVCRTLKIPNGLQFLAAVSGALLDLTQYYNWEPDGSLTPDQTAVLFQQMFDDYRESRGCLIGTIFAHANAIPPIGSLACDGATYADADYPILAADLDAAYRVDATHFRVPDLRGRTVIGTGQGSGLSDRAIDVSGGEESHILSVSEMPAHTHSYVGATTTPYLAGELVSTITAFPANFQTGSAGGDQAHNNMHPFLALHYAIWAV